MDPGTEPAQNANPAATAEGSGASTSPPPEKKQTPGERAIAKVRKAQAAAKPDDAGAKPPAEARPVEKKPDPPADKKPAESEARVAELTGKVRDLSTKVTDLEARAAKGDKFDALLKKIEANPVAIFSELPGLSWEKLATDFEKISADPAELARRAVDERVKGIEEELKAEREKNAKTAAEKARVEQDESAKATLKGIVGKDADRWERVNRVPEAMAHLRQAVIARLKPDMADEDVTVLVEEEADKLEARFDEIAASYARKGKARAATGARTISSATPSAGAVRNGAGGKKPFDKKALIDRVRKVQQSTVQ
jgi:vacuolar-type H+-ATPase subunit I/STV1